METKQKKLTKNRKPQEEGRLKNRPLKHLSKEDFLQIRVTLLELDKIKLELNNLQGRIESNEKTNYIMRQQMAEKKNNERKVRIEHEAFIEDLRKRTGIDIKGKSIDFITREVKDIEEN